LAKYTADNQTLTRQNHNTFILTLRFATLISPTLLKCILPLQTDSILYGYVSNDVSFTVNVNLGKLNEENDIATMIYYRQM
jgi:hypothetical protein